MENRTFEVREDHIKLLRNMSVTWNYSCSGSPTIDPKRPYGESMIFEGMAKLLNMVEPNEDGEVELTDEQIDSLSKLHEEMQTVLEILLYNCSIQQGTYVNKGYLNEWILLQ